MKYCKVKIDFKSKSYLFTLNDLNSMVNNGTRVFLISSSSLETNGEIATLIKFAEVMRKMKHLKEFNFDCGYFKDQNAPPMELLTDLPFKYLRSHQFNIYGKRDVQMMVSTISKIKSRQGDHKNSSFLRGFQLMRNVVSDYLLTPDDFKLLKNLPLTYVDLRALDLKQDNIKDFREIMKQMKILDIKFYYQLFPRRKDFRIDVEKFGPGRIYNTIIAINDD
eukprot:TCONS_00042297-protein